MVQETKELGEQHHAQPVLITLSTYEYRTIVAKVKDQSFTALPTVQPKSQQTAQWPKVKKAYTQKRKL